MEKYYLIPMMENNVCFNDRSLRDILFEIYPIFSQRENDRINLLHSTSPLYEVPYSVQMKIKKHNAETRELYKKNNIPRYLIVKEKDDVIEEILTKGKITSECYIGQYEVSFETAEEYYEGSNYAECILNFLATKDLVTEKDPFNNKHNIAGYIEGTLDGKPIKGHFEGKIKILNKSNSQS